MKPVVLFFLLLCTSCTWQTNDFLEQLSKENLTKIELKTLNIRLMLPKEHFVSEINRKISINLNPKGRAVKQFSINKSKSTIDSVKFKESFIFENGAKLEYNTFITEGGSGGTEFCLSGIFQFEDKTYQITSSIQEDIKEQCGPEFCLRYLSTVAHHQFP